MRKREVKDEIGEERSVEMGDVRRVHVHPGNIY